MNSSATRSFSGIGLAVGLLFFTVSLTPSLLPRPLAIQGVLSGLALAVGYGIGASLSWLWRFLQLPKLAWAGKWATCIAIAVAVGLATLTLARAADWQNSIREVMNMPAVDAVSPLQILGIALAVAATVVLIARLLIWLGKKFVRSFGLVLPPRLAAGIGVLGFVCLMLLILNGLVVEKALTALDKTFAKLDREIDDGVTAPMDHASSGSPASLIEWDGIGRTGKGFIANSSNAQDITAVTSRPAATPIRVYAGYNSADTLEGRAQLALDDLIRAGGFERKTLVVATATGTGWLDPAAMEPLVFLQDGDVAIVTIQYSYLPSWLTLIIDPDRSRVAAKVLFDRVYAHWTTLPHDTRPKLFLFGLSLGALGSESSVDLITQFEDPINGALWAGPPFASSIWPQVVAGRTPGSPAWRPEFRDGAMIRFMNRDGVAAPQDATWGKMRLLYLQHPSDPMIFVALPFNLRRDAFGDNFCP